MAFADVVDVHPVADLYGIRANAAVQPEGTERRSALVRPQYVEVL